MKDFSSCAESAFSRSPENEGKCSNASEKQGGPSALSPAMALLPLRLFLGITFVYAGIQKLSDPGFLHAGAPTYIGTQLHGFAAARPAASSCAPSPCRTRSWPGSGWRSSRS